MSCHREVELGTVEERKPSSRRRRGARKGRGVSQGALPSFASWELESDREVFWHRLATVSHSRSVSTRAQKRREERKPSRRISSRLRGEVELGLWFALLVRLIAWLPPESCSRKTRRNAANRNPQRKETRKGEGAVKEFCAAIAKKKDVGVNGVEK